ncbi:MAG: FecCD family ABC transporter permease [Pelagimonas sp.]|uniref:FecCD family ABC transporter permease n=1 Tax=Pelagimonas sp. TaxID=2073170 RepID=UPI003D6B3979
MISPSREQGRAAVPTGLSAVVLVIALVVGGLLSMSTGGRSDVGFTDLFAHDDLASMVLIEIRAPRSIAAALLGVNLGLAGLVLQAITRNPLASPAILGINQGAALGLALAFVLPGLSAFPDVMAVVGAFLAGTASFAIAGGFQARMEPMRLMLGGIAVGAFAYAMVRFTFTLEDDIARTVVRWVVGDITDIRWPAALRLAAIAVPGVIAAMALAHRLNLMALGEDQAQGLGGDPRVTLFLGAVLAAGLTGICVTVAGPIGFAGLIVPNLARALFTGDHRVLVPMTALIGAALMLVADGLSKILTAPIEAPIGVIVALIGAPWFLWLTLRTRDLP